MPVTGRKPGPGPRRNRSQPVHGWAEIADVPFTTGPKLPAKRPDGKPWRPPTRAWWRAISSMPHCVLWEPSDWQYAVDTAYVAAAFHDGNQRAAAELRQREKIMGTTVDARRDLRIRYVDPGEVEEDRTGVAQFEDYRRRIEQSTQSPPGPYRPSA